MDNSNNTLSIERSCHKTKSEGHVLVLYTGGTIGMDRNANGVLVPVANTFIQNIRKYPHMHDSQYAEERFGVGGPLVLPITATNRRRIIYNIVEYPKLSDSSNMTMDDWIKIGKDIRESYDNFDGFVVLHGTDTLSYTASALSFMLEDLGKAVILTGSQVPIFDARSDGLDNFLSALVIAANYDIPEVCVFFGKDLMRGNRTSKVSASSFDAFHSPNFPPLATAQITIEVDYRVLLRPRPLAKFHVHGHLNRNVSLLRLFPSITRDLVRAFLQPPVEGVVLQSYGSGNVPTNRKDIIEELRTATKRGVIVVNTTQCTTGCVSNTYETGRILEEAGVTSGLDMTPEAALTKLAYVLSKAEWCTKIKRQMMKTDLRGELTPRQSSAVHDNNDFVEIVTKTLISSSTPEQLRELKSSLLSTVLNAAVFRHDISQVEALIQRDVDVSQANTDGRTALHVACCEGDFNVALCLLNMGANVDAKDRFNRTPLTDAIDYDRHDIIKLLLQYGAHLHDTSTIAEKICVAAATGNTKRLQSFHVAGANLSMRNISGMAPLHFAALHNQTVTLRFLLGSGVDSECSDLIGHTARELAEVVGANEAIDVLDSQQKNSHSSI